MSIDVARESARGSLILFLGNLVSTILSAVATILIARLLGPSGYGLYTLAFVIPYTLQLFIGFGISFSATRYSSYYLSRGMGAKAVQITRSAVAILLFFGIVLAVFNYYAGPYLADLFLKRPGLSPYVRLASLVIIGQAIAQASTSALVGWNSMGGFSLSYVLQGLVKLAVSPLLILIGFGVYGAIIGQVSSSLAFGATATFAIYIAMRKVGSTDWSGTFAHLREMIAYGVPLFVGGIAAGLAAQYLTVILAIIATNTVIGLYQAGVNATVAVTLISGAISNSLFRSFATLDGLEGDLASAFRYAVHYVSYLLTPVVFFLAASSDALYSVLYGPSYVSGSILLKLLAISFMPVAVGLTVIPSFLNGVGRSRLSMLMSLAGAASLVVAGPVLAVSLSLNVEGIIYAMLVSNAVTAVLGIAVSMKYLGARLEATPLVGIVVASSLAWLSISLLPRAGFSQAVSLVLNLVVFAAVYFTAVPFLRGIRGEDLTRLGAASHGMGFIGGASRLLLGYQARLLRITEHGRKP